MKINPPFLIDGASHQTVTALAAAYRVPYATLLARLRSGKSVEEAVRTPVVRQKRRPKQTYKIDGKCFNTLTAVAKAYDIPYDTFAARMRNGWGLERAVREPVINMERREWEVFGIIYPSLSAAAKAYDKGPEDIRQRVKAGMTLEDALTLPSQREKLITVHGRCFPSVAAAARDYGIDLRTFRSRLRRGWSPERAVDEDPASNIPMTVEGITYPSIMATANAYGLPPALIRKRKEHGWNDEDAVLIPSGAGYQIEYEGVVYSSLNAACEVTGMDPRSASYRLNAGWDLDTALDPNADVDNRKSIVVQGIEYPTLSAAAREFGINPGTFMQRVRHEWTPEQAAGLEEAPEFKAGTAPIPAAEYLKRLALVHGDTLDFSQEKFGKALEKVKVLCNVDQRHPPFWASANNLLRGRSCPVCKASSGEREVFLWLELHGFEYEREWTGHDIEPKNGRGVLRFDFHLPNLRTLIEYDGHQHFEPVTFGGMTEDEARTAHERTVENDRKKNEWASANGYDMIRIHFEESVEEKLSKALL